MEPSLRFIKGHRAMCGEYAGFWMVVMRYLTTPELARILSTTPRESATM